MLAIVRHPADTDGAALRANVSGALSDVCLAQPACAAILRLLSAQPTTFMSVDDIAAPLGLPVEQAAAALELLCEQGFVRRVSVTWLAFYGLTDDPRRREDVRVFQAWCDERRQTWERMRTLIG